MKNTVRKARVAVVLLLVWSSVASVLLVAPVGVRHESPRSDTKSKIHLRRHADVDYAWWNASWQFRVKVNVTAPPVNGSRDAPVQLGMNFTDVIQPYAGQFNKYSVRVVEYTAKTEYQELECQFDPAPLGWNNGTNATGDVIWVLNGTTPPGATRTFFVYFDVDAAGEDTPAITDPGYFSDKIRLLAEDFEDATPLTGYSSFDLQPNAWDYNTTKAVEGQRSLRIHGNSWKKILLSEEIPLETNYLLTFALYVNDTATNHEIVGVMLSEDEDYWHSNALLYNVHGSSGSCNTSFQAVYPQDQWNYYTCHVGTDNVEVVNVTELVFVADDDMLPTTGNLFFDDIALWNRTVNVSGAAYPTIEQGALGMFPVAPYLHMILPAIDTDGNITLYWDPAFAADQYHLFRDNEIIDDLSDVAGTVPIKTTTGTVYNDEVDTNDTFYYAVIAENEYGNSSLSPVRSVQVHIEPPPVPTAPLLQPITPDPNTDGNVTLHWTRSAGASFYAVYRYQTPVLSFNESLTEVGTPSANTTTDQVTVNGTYYYAIRAVNSSGPSPLSNTEGVTVAIEPPPPPVPSAPVLNITSPVPSTTGNITLQWTEEEGATSYLVFRETAHIESVQDLANITYTTDITYTDYNRPNGTYYYVVVAANASGWSPGSNCVNVTVGIPLPESETYEEVELEVGVTILNTTELAGFHIQANFTTLGQVNVTLRQYLSNPTGIDPGDAAAVFFFNISCSNASCIRFPVYLRVWYNQELIAGFIEDNLYLYRLSNETPPTWVRDASIRDALTGRIFYNASRPGVYMIVHEREYHLVPTMDKYVSEMALFIQLVIIACSLGFWYAYRVNKRNLTKLRTMEEEDRKEVEKIWPLKFSARLLLVVLVGGIILTAVNLISWSVYLANPAVGPTFVTTVIFLLVVAWFYAGVGIVGLRYKKDSDADVQELIDERLKDQPRDVGPYANLFLVMPVGILVMTGLTMYYIDSPIYQSGMLTLMAILYTTYLYTILAYFLREKFLRFSLDDLEWKGVTLEQIARRTEVRNLPPKKRRRLLNRFRKKTKAARLLVKAEGENGEDVGKDAGKGASGDDKRKIEGRELAPGATDEAPFKKRLFSNERLARKFKDLKFYKPKEGIRRKYIVYYAALIVFVVAYQYIFYYFLRFEENQGFIFFIQSLPSLQAVLWAAHKILTLEKFKRGFMNKDSLEMEKSEFSLAGNITGSLTSFFISFLPYITKFLDNYVIFWTEMQRYLMVNLDVVILIAACGAALGTFVGYYLWYDFRRR